jgi:hypothetical protein
MSAETTTTIDEFLDTIAPAGPVLEPAETDEQDPTKVKQRKPPSGGMCRRCGENKPINRLMLCYPCWVKSNLEESGWREGMPHPDWCACEGIKDHVRLSDGN